MAYISYMLSADTIATTLLFVVPKFMTDNEIIQDEIPPDLFLNSSVMIADIYGFTAWTSVREPVQIFKFLETLYERFDSIADRYGIFKVDTTGEHYGKSYIVHSCFLSVWEAYSKHGHFSITQWPHQDFQKQGLIMQSQWQDLDPNV